MTRAAAGVSIRNGIGKRFTAVMRLFTNPGQITDTPIPCPARSPRNDSPYTRTAALLAQ